MTLVEKLYLLNTLIGLVIIVLLIDYGFRLRKSYPYMNEAKRKSNFLYKIFNKNRREK